MRDTVQPIQECPRLYGAPSMLWRFHVCAGIPFFSNICMKLAWEIPRLCGNTK